MANKLPLSGYILGLDVGEKRIGVAVASVIAKLPQPLDMIPAGEHAVDQIKLLITKEEITLVVVGLPRNSQGQETAQSKITRNFVAELVKITEVPVVLADESLSSVRAEDLRKDNTFKNVSSDSLAACFILEEYFVTNLESNEGAGI